jgi:ATP dependent DNA ligase C terminal region
MKALRWVKPNLVAEISFVEWTDHGHLRHPKFVGLRADKKPKEVRRETGGCHSLILICRFPDNPSHSRRHSPRLVPDRVRPLGADGMCEISRACHRRRLRATMKRQGDRQMSTLTSAIECPAVASLDVWVRQEWTDGLQVDRLSALDELAVQTRNSLYRMVLLDPLRGEVLVQGGRFFPDSTRAQFAGCSLGGAFLKLRGIHIGFRMEIHFGLETIITSDVLSVEVISSGRVH